MGRLDTHKDTGSVLDYTGLLNVEEAETYSKISTAVTDYQNQNVPNVIKGAMSWDDYVKGFDNIDPDCRSRLVR